MGKNCFCTFLNKFQIIFLCETWLKKESNVPFTLKEYKCYNFPKEHQAHFGRTSGGIMALISNDLLKLGVIKEVKSVEPETIIIGIDKVLFGTDKDVTMCLAYVAPEGATLYKRYCEQDGIAMLTDTLLNIHDSHYIISGDLNSRIGNIQDFIENDNLKYLSFADDYPSSNFNIKRYSNENEVNNFGYSLLDLCHCLDVYTLNGRLQDVPGSFTCFPATGGKSLVDYILVDAVMYSNVKHFEVISQTSSDHLPVAGTFSTSTKILKCKNQVALRQRYKWQDCKENLFKTRLNDEKSDVLLDELIESINALNTNKSVSLLCELLYYAGESMKLKPHLENVKNQPTWWDQECDYAKYDKLIKINVFRKTQLNIDLTKYKESKRKLC